MIEKRRPPLVAVVAGRAVRAAHAELIRVWILVAINTFVRNIGEIDVDQRSLQVRRSVTIHARHRTM